MSDNSEILRAVETLLKHSVPTGTPSTPYTHGPGGLFGVAGIERDLYHTRLAGSGLAWRLPFSPSVMTDPYFAYITGFTDPDESNPEGVCDYPPAAGSMKTCLQTAPFGRYSYKTREMEINRVGQLINRGEFDDLQVLNDPLVPELGRSLFPSLSGNSQISSGAEVLSRWLELGVKFVNKLGRQIFTGTPANNTAGGGYKEFIGLDLLIGTNKVDAITGTDCPSLYSDVKDFAYAKVDAASNDPDIVETLTTLLRFVKHTAEYTGMMPVKWVLVMRRTLFWEITDIWPCRYLTYRCQSWRDTGGLDPVGSFDSAEAIRMRDAMRNGRYLTVDGENIEVIIDDFIVEESSNNTNKIDVGCFASDIYLIPMTAAGRAVTYWQHYDYRAGTMQAVSDGKLSNDYWTDGGVYMWHKLPPLMWCDVWAAKIEPRIILRTPHLAGRLTNVQYCPLQHVRDVHPDDSYFVDGGVTDRDPPSLYNDYTEYASRQK